MENKLGFYAVVAVLAVAVLAVLLVYFPAPVTGNVSMGDIESEPVKATEENFFTVLEKSQDFRDFKDDFKKSNNREYDPVLREQMQMTYVNIRERKELWEQDPGTAPFVAIFDGVNPSKTTYYVEFSDSESPSWEGMAVLDMEKGKPLKFFRLIRLSVSAGT